MYKLTTLDNGLRLITAPMRGTKTATVLVMVGTGSKYESKRSNGIAHFLEHMFFKGTARRPNTLALSSELDAIGADFNAFTGKEYTGYFIKCDARKLELALDVVSDMLLNSKFSATEIEREKGVIMEEINMYHDNPMRFIEDVFESCLYGDTPAGWDTLGTRETVSGFKRKDFIDYLEGQYGTHNTFLLATGNIGSMGRIRSLAKKYFVSGKFSNRGKSFREKTAVQEEQHRPMVKIHEKKTDQAHLSLGVRTFGYDHKDKAVVKLIALILGGSMSSRLFISLRERQGLAYYVRTDNEVYTDTGYLATNAGVPTAGLEQAIAIILREYRRLRTTPVGVRELKRARDMLAGRMAIHLEGSDDLANWYGRQAVLDDAAARTGSTKRPLRVITPEKYLANIKKISPNDIKRVAKRIFVNEGLNLAIIGPYREEKKFEKLLKL